MNGAGALLRENREGRPGGGKAPRPGPLPSRAEAEAGSQRRRKRPPPAHLPRGGGLSGGRGAPGAEAAAPAASPLAGRPSFEAGRAPLRRRLPRRHLGLLSPGRRARPFRPRLFPSRRQPELAPGPAAPALRRRAKGAAPGRRGFAVGPALGTQHRAAPPPPAARPLRHSGCLAPGRGCARSLSFRATVI